ncbi:MULTISPECIES: AAA family ATPase [Pandoraea]|uniref:ParA family protein n=1 Tax=Pandoraea TaxID=93217 RepID=UPI001F5CE07F|nr:MULTISPECIES: AAA family ATPase [Pandoraea]
MAKRLVPINYTAGISNTSFIYHLGWLLAENYRVLLVDADPKCDLTSLVLREGFDQHYRAETTCRHNLKDATRAAFELDAFLIREIDCPAPPESPNLRLLPGHANLAECDFQLTLVQDANARFESMENTPGAFHHLISLCERKYDIDFTLINVPAGFGGVSANLFMHSDVFVVPVTPDPFAVKTLHTLKYVLARWINWKKNSMGAFARTAYPLGHGTPKFGGILNRPIVDYTGSIKRPAFEDVEKIRYAISNDFVPHLSTKGMTFPLEQYPPSLLTEGFRLGEIEDYSELHRRSLEVGIPAFALSDSDIDAFGASIAHGKMQRDHLRIQLESVAADLASLLNHA